MAEERASANDQKTEQGTEQKDFKSLSLSEMEAELSKVPKEVQAEADEADDSVDSEEESEETKSAEAEEEVTDETSEEDSEEVVEETAPKDKVKSDKSDKSPDVNKAYKELQAEFTRRSQQLKELQAKVAELSQQKPAQSDAEKAVANKFAQLKKNNPNATKFLDELQEAVADIVQEKLQEKVAPIEERVTLRTRQENVAKFDRDIEAFKNSELSELEPEVLAIYNSEPNFWQRVIFDNENAFQQLVNKAILANLDKVADLKSRKKQASPKTTKEKMLEKARVGKPSGATKEVPTKAFRELSLEEMEKALPKGD